jgi:hypothetical protein
MEFLCPLMQLIYVLCQQVLCLARCNEQSCPSTGYDPSIACSCLFPGRPAAHACNVENMVPQKDEAVSPFPGGKVWRPGDVCVYKYFCLVLDIRQSHVG